MKITAKVVVAAAGAADQARTVAGARAGAAANQPASAAAADGVAAADGLLRVSGKIVFFNTQPEFPFQ